MKTVHAWPVRICFKFEKSMTGQLNATIKDVIRTSAKKRSRLQVQADRGPPSAINGQNWHFTAIRDSATIEKLNGWIAAEIKESRNPNLAGILERAYGRAFRNAPCVASSSQRKNRTGSALSTLPLQYRTSFWPLAPSGLEIRALLRRDSRLQCI